MRRGSGSEWRFCGIGTEALADDGPANDHAPKRSQLGRNIREDGGMGQHGTSAGARAYVGGVR